MRHLARALIFITCMGAAALADHNGKTKTAGAMLLWSAVAPIFIINGKDKA
jgi:hypothetical protein